MASVLKASLSRDELIARLEKYMWFKPETEAKNLPAVAVAEISRPGRGTRDLRQHGEAQRFM